jgi:hypothetical protein
MSKEPWEADLTPAVRRVTETGDASGGGGDQAGDASGAGDRTAGRGPPSDDRTVWADLTPAVRRVTDGEDDSSATDPGSATGFADPHPVDAPNLTPAVTRVRGRERRIAEGDTLPADVRKYDRFKKVDGATYDRVNDFLRDRTYVTAREWAIARLCADFRTETGVEMTKIGENLPFLVPFMTDTYTPQAVNQARSAFRDKVRKAGATFLYGAMCDFFTADELDDVMYEATEVAKFLLEVEGVDLAVEDELDAEDRISSVMREVRQASDSLRHEGVECPECGHEFDASTADHADHASADD